MMRFVPLFIFLLLAVALGFALVKPESVQQQATPYALPKLALRPFEGEAKFVPGKIMLINFFASWCAPCKLEHIELEMLALNKKLVVHGIIFNDSDENIRRWISDYGNPYRGLWRDEDGSAAIALGVRGVPESFVIDKKGMVRYRLAGPITEQIRVKTIEPLIRTLEAE